MKLFLKFGWIAVVALGLSLPTGAQAQSCVDGYDDTVSFVSNGRVYQTERLVSYFALIGERDLYNSKGTRLRNFAAIIQQDRANLHKSGRADVSGDFREQRDHYFTTLSRRTFLSTARYYMPCYFSAADAKRFKSSIVNGRVLGILGVVVFRHPDGSPAVFIEPVN